MAGGKPDYSLSGSEKRSKKTSPVKKYFHAFHPRRICHAPRFMVEFLSISDYNKGMPLVTGGSLTVRFTVDKRDKNDLLNSRFEIIFFIDKVFVYEEESGISPFNYRFSVKDLNRGEHVITVNVYGLEDYIGTRSVKILLGGNGDN